MCNRKYAERETEAVRRQRLEDSRARFFTLFQVAFGLPVGFSASLEGSVIKRKSTAPALQDIYVHVPQ